MILEIISRYRVYIGGVIYLSILVLFGIHFATNIETARETNSSAFSHMLKDGKVEKIVVVNKEKAYVYINRNFLSEKEFEDVSEKIFGYAPNYGPHYYLKIDSLEELINVCEMIRKQFKDINLLFETRKENTIIFGWILPLLIALSALAIILRLYKNSWRI